MVQEEKVVKSPAVVKKIPEAQPARPSSTPYLINALAIVTLAFLMLAGWTVYKHYSKTPAERVAQEVAPTWDTATPGGLNSLYARQAVLIQADGTKVVGSKAIIAAAKSLGPSYTMTQAAGVAATPDGSYATLVYRYAGKGSGEGVAVIQISGGKIVRQWNYESIAVPAPASK